MKFLNESHLTTVAVERKLASERLRFAGTIDFVGADEDGYLVVCDWKGTVTKTVDLQLGAYSILWSENQATTECDKVVAAVAVECADDGSYKCRWLDAAALRLAGQVFKAMLTTWAWRKQNGYNGKKQS